MSAAIAYGLILAGLVVLSSCVLAFVFERYGLEEFLATPKGRTDVR